MSRVRIDIGSTYIKVCVPEINFNEQYFRDFTVSISSDLMNKCSAVISQYNKDEISICSSANDGLKIFCIGLTNSFSLRFLEQTALNAGGNIIGSIILAEKTHYPLQNIDTDILMISGAVNLENYNKPDTELINFIREKIIFRYIVFAGNQYNIKLFKKIFPEMITFDNILDEKLLPHNNDLLDFIKSQYFKDIVKKEEISSLYDFTGKNIYPTPYIVNQAYINSIINQETNTSILPYIAVDIGGATTDIHYSREIVSDGREKQTYNRIVFKNLGIYKSKDNLLYSLMNNEYTREFALSLDLPFPEKETDKTKYGFTPKILALYALFLVLLKTSNLDNEISLELDFRKIKSILITGGACKLLGEYDVEKVLIFLLRKLQIYQKTTPNIFIDKEYNFWSNGFNNLYSDEGSIIE
jgi:hypothetical protein